MSSGVMNIQAQVESVLGALLKVATVELTKLFESRYRAADVETGRTGGGTRSEAPDEAAATAATTPVTAPCAGERRRSIGVQVDEDVELSGPLVLSGGDCLEVEVEAGLILLAPGGACVDPQWPPVKEQAGNGTVNMVELSFLDAECPAAEDPQTESVEPDPKRGPPQSSPVKEKILVISPDMSDAATGNQKKYVCPLILKPDTHVHKPDSSEVPVRAEPQPSCVSTASGTAYSPSKFDGAVTPSQTGVWERIHSPLETKNHLQIKLKLTSPDTKLSRPCAVQLVNFLTTPETAAPPGEQESDAAPKGCSIPKDLRRHKGAHTGHRLCCFSPCGDGVWQLKNTVPPSHDGYECNSCGKTFKRRKVLRRHERFHTGERPYACSQCPKTFALRKSFCRHLRFHTGERPHSCTQCGKSFRLRDNLKAHLRFHTGEKPFSCTKCGKTFRILRNLEKHKVDQCVVFVPSFRKIAGM